MKTNQEIYEVTLLINTLKWYGQSKHSELNKAKVIITQNSELFYMNTNMEFMIVNMNANIENFMFNDP